MTEEKDIKNLKFRYLLLFYKAAKQEFDRIERKFTQLEIDKKILENMKEKMRRLEPELKNGLTNYFEEFKDYLVKKERGRNVLKLEKESLRPEYLFLSLKLRVIEEIIVRELGEDKKDEIKALYETEMRKRILAAKDR